MSRRAICRAEITVNGLVAAEARRNGLSEPEAVDLMRRAEVVIGAVSARHLRLDENGLCHVRHEPHRAVKQEICKTVGLAYVGSNPAPATTCGNGP